jgi:hypothetical protein
MPSMLHEATVAFPLRGHHDKTKIRTPSGVRISSQLQLEVGGHSFRRLFSCLSSWVSQQRSSNLQFTLSLSRLCGIFFIAAIPHFVRALSNTVFVGLPSRGILSWGQPCNSEALSLSLGYPNLTYSGSTSTTPEGKRGDFSLLPSM